jgi:hypothetical protein
MPPTTQRAGFLRHLLWIDCTGAAVVGVLVLAFSGWLSRLEGLPQEVLIFTGAVNLLYAGISFSLAVRPERTRRHLALLVLANLAWAPVCIGLLIAFATTATLFALLHLGGEAVYVATLAVLEGRNRDLLRTRMG